MKGHPQVVRHKSKAQLPLIQDVNEYIHNAIQLAVKTVSE